MLTPTHLLRALGSAGALGALTQRIPAFQALSEYGTILFLEERWSDDTVAISGVLALDTRKSIDALGVRIAFGTVASGELFLPFSLQLPADLAKTAFVGVSMLSGLIDTEKLADDFDLDDLSDLDAFFGQFADEFAQVALSLGPVPVRVEFSTEYLTPGRHIKDAAGKAIAVEAIDDAPAQISIGLGDATLAVSAAGVDIALSGGVSVTLAPLMLAGTGLAVELKGLTAKLTAGSVPPALAALGAERGFDEQWRGLFAEEVTVWNLDKVFPSGPEGDAAEASSSRITASGMAIDTRGLTGVIGWQRTPQEDERIALDNVDIVFDRTWYPTTVEAGGRVGLGDIGGDVIAFKAALELDPFGTGGPEWRLLGHVVGQAQGQPIARFEEPPAEFTAALGVASLALGDSDLALMLSALSAGAEADILEVRSIAVPALTISGTLNSAGLSLSASASLEARIDIVALTEPVELFVRINDIALGYDSAAGFTCGWTLADGVDLVVPLDVDIGGAVTLERAGLRRRDDRALVIELGVAIDGVGDIAIGGLPNVVSLVYQPGPPASFNVDLARDGQELTLLVPGTLYAKGVLKRSATSFPGLGVLPWGETLYADVTAYLVGNGTAIKPEHHLQKSSYMFALDVGILTATRQDGLKALVVSGDLSFKPGLPLGTTGAALYGLGLTYAQNAAPSARDGDYTGWFLETAPQYSTHTRKWEPSVDAWGFGAAVTLGSQPDDGRAWNVAAGLFMLLPGPVVMITGKGSMFSPPPELPKGGAGASISAPFAAAVALDFQRDRLSAELAAQINVSAGSKSLLELQIPASIEASIGAPIDMELAIGSYADKKRRVRGKALGLYDISTYLVVSTTGVDNFPRQGMRLPGFATAYGGSGGLSAGFSSSLAELRISVQAGFDVGASLANPPLIAGRLYIDGSILARVACISINVGIETDLMVVAPQPFELSGSVGIRVGLPWPIPDIRFSGSMRIGAESKWPGDYPQADDPIAQISLFPRPNGTTNLENGESFDGLVLDETTLTEGVPVDAGILCSFRAPVGNTDPTIGLISTYADDLAHVVWEVASTGQNDSGEELRYGWRHVLTGIELRESGTPIAASGGWDPKAMSGNTEGADRSAPGEQADRRTLCLLAPLDTPVERRYGTGAEVLAEMIEGWRPCEELPNEKAFRALFTLPDGMNLGVGPIRGPARIPFDKWTPLHRHSPFAGPNGRIRCRAPLSGVAAMAPPFFTLPPQLWQRPQEFLVKVDWEIREQPFVITPPAAILGRQVDIDALMAADLDPPCGSLEVYIPDDGMSRMVLVAVRRGVILDVRGEDGARLEPFEIPNAGFVNGRDEVWELQRIMLPEHSTTISMAAYQLESLTPGVLGLGGAALLGATLFLEYEVRQQAAQRRRDGAVELVTDVGDLASGWAAGSSDGLLKPGTRYELEITVQSHRARQTGTGEVEIESGFTQSKRKAVFKTEADIAQPLAPRLAPTSWAPDVIMPYTILALPAAGQFSYREESINIELTDAVSAGRIAAHGRKVMLRLMHESGRTVTEAADEILSEAKKQHSELQDIIADYIEGQPCLSDRDPMHLSLKYRFATLLEAGEYEAELLAADEVGQRPDALLHRWRFCASRWETWGAHIAAHRPAPIVLPGSASQVAQRAAAALGGNAQLQLDDALLDGILHEIAQVAPIMPPTQPLLRIPYHADGVACLVIDGPEPLLQGEDTLSLRHDGRPVAISGIAANSIGSRAVICLASPVNTGRLELHLARDAKSGLIRSEVPIFAPITEPA